MRDRWARWVLVLASTFAVACGTNARDGASDASPAPVDPWDTGSVVDEDAPVVLNCRYNDDCDTGQWCNPEGLCVPGCRNSAECLAANGGGAAVRCDPVTHQCSGCLVDDDCPAGYLCTAGSVCTPGCTEAHKCREDFTCCDGRCIDVTSDMANCGACGAVCAPTRATGACVDGICEVVTCVAGWDDCDELGSTGCETFLATDVAHCGACGDPCHLPNATPSCVDGFCAVASCAAGFGDCDLDPFTGCEQPLITAEHCGACNVDCDPDEATASCATGKCVITACSEGHADCDGKVSNGCEAELAVDPKNCGKCGNACPASAPVCDEGVCGAADAAALP